MAELDQLLGSPISLISVQNVRYDGILYSINAKESSIILRDVKCLGTEDRVTDAGLIVPANPSITAYVDFPGHDIKDLFVHEPSTDNLPPPPPPTSSNKESRSSGGAELDKSRNQSNNRPPIIKNENSKSDKQTSSYNKFSSQNNNVGQANQEHDEQTQRREKSETNQNRGGGRSGRGRGRGSSGPAAGTGEHLLRMRVRRGANNTTGEGGPEQVDGEFDFDEGLSHFNKEEVLTTTVAEEMPKVTPYKKDDFFDDFGADEDRESYKRLTSGEERALNQDTFGAIALQSNYRRGYGGRGGQGYNRGGGSGGFGRGGGQQGRGRGGRGGRGGGGRGGGGGSGGFGGGRSYGGRGRGRGSGAGSNGPPA